MSKLISHLTLRSRFSEVISKRGGSSILSKIFRHIFEHKNLKKIIGSNIALAVIATSTVPGAVNGANITNQLPTVKEAIPLTTVISGTHLPVNILKVTQKYSVFHPGIDMDGTTGDHVKAIQSGFVEKVEYSKVGYGNHIYINHGNGVISLYAHLSKIFVKQGDSVSIDQLIGLMGSTGRSTGDHLHLEVRVNGRAVDPLKVLN